jgi:hypothetical protein
MWDAEAAVLVALANRATNDLTAIGPGVAVGASTSSMSGAATGETTLRAHYPRFVLPAVDVTIDLPWEGPAPAVQALSGRPVGVTVVDGRLRVDLARVEAWEGLRIPR